MTAEQELLRRAYAAYDDGDLDALLALVSEDVDWPDGTRRLRGAAAVRAYWTQQWSEIDPHVEPVSFHPEGAGHILVDVHQVVRDLAGAVLGDEHVGHRFTIEDGLIQAMEVCPLPSPGGK